MVNRAEELQKNGFSKSLLEFSLVRYTTNFGSPELQSTPWHHVSMPQQLCADTPMLPPECVKLWLIFLRSVAFNMFHTLLKCLFSGDLPVKLSPTMLFATEFPNTIRADILAAPKDEPSQRSPQMGDSLRVGTSLPLVYGLFSKDNTILTTEDILFSAFHIHSLI